MRIEPVKPVFDISIIGKAPGWGDFIHHHAGGKAGPEFEEWIRRGISSSRVDLGGAWDAAFKNMPAYHFIFSADTPGYFLAGVLIPSQDQLSRAYPLAGYLEFSPPQPGGVEGRLLPLLFDPAYPQMRQVLESLLQKKTRDSDLREFWNIRIRIADDLAAVQRSYQSYLDHTTFENFCINLWGLENVSAKYTVFQNLLSILRPLRDQRFARFTLGLRFPLSNKREHIPCEIGFWLHLISRCWDRPIPAPALFWNPESEATPPGLLLFFQPPPGDRFRFLFNAAQEHEQLCVLERDGRALAKNLNDPLRELLDSPRVMLAEILNAVPEIDHINLFDLKGENHERNTC